MHYIIVTRDNDLWLVGPFDTSKAAADYGATAEPRIWCGDLRWQTISLNNTYGLRVEKPAKLRVVEGAYGRAGG